MTPDEIANGIAQIRCRIRDLEGFDSDKASLPNGSPELFALEASIATTLSRVFGESSLEFRAYIASANLWPCRHLEYYTPRAPNPLPKWFNYNRKISLALLRQAIEGLQEQAGRDQMHDKIHLAVIVALPEEYRAFCNHFDDRIVAKLHIDSLTIDILQIRDADERIGLLCVNRMGNVPAAIAATRLSRAFDLELIVNIGLAAGVDNNKQGLGDILVADKIRYYETGKQREGKLSVAPEYSDLRSSYLDVLQKEDLTTWPIGTAVNGQQRRVFFGTIASGEKVISDSGFVTDLISQDRKIIGIEMESYGIAAAVRDKRTKLLFIRGICDFADETKEDLARRNAMDGAIRLFHVALRRGLLKASDVQGLKTKPSETFLTLKDKTVEDGIANTYFQVARSPEIIDEVKYRRSVINRLSNNFATMGDLKVFCTELKIDFDEIVGDTKRQKAGGNIRLLGKIYEMRH